MRMKRNRFWTLLAIAATALAAGFSAYNSQGETPVIVHFDIDANPRVVDEGELVEFEILNSRYIDAATGEVLEFPPSVEEKIWDFDDGTDVVKVPGNSLHTSHRFANNRIGGYEVNARILDSRSWVKVKVRNVAPEIYEVLRTRPALQGEPVEFQALARDPGIEDELTYTWDFGDGDTATGEHVEHTYPMEGTYSVTVTVDDGDAGTDTETFEVPVGDVGFFDVSGQIRLSRTKIEKVILAGTTKNPFARNPQDPCSLRLQMHGNRPEDGLGFTLTAVLTPGLGERHYRVGSKFGWDGTHRDENASPGVFFGDFSPPRTMATRNFSGRIVGGPFWSRSGRVHVEYFDGDYFELTFDVELIEEIPGRYDPRRVRVKGMLAQKVGESRGDSITNMIGSVAGSKFYFCGRDEGEFDIAGRKPDVEAINVDFLNPVIEVAFTEPVDPRSVQGKFTLEYRGTEGFEKVPGSWRPIAGDPKAVEFVPQARLKQGTIHCIRVETEEEGVRGKEGERLQVSLDSLFSDETRPACEKQSMEFGTREWAFATRPEIRSAIVDVYQASVAGDGTPLVPGKPTVSRVYTHWADPPKVHDTARVKDIPARVTILAHNDSPVYAPEPRATIKRPSLFTRDDKKNARNSTNFYNWRPIGSGRMSVRAKIEPLDENGQRVSEFEGAVTELERWSRSDSLTVDYRFLELEVDFHSLCREHLERGCREQCETSAPEGIEPCVEDCVLYQVPSCVGRLERTYAPETDLEKVFDLADVWEGRRLAQEGARFTTQNFPVVSTAAKEGKPLKIVLADDPSLGLATLTAMRFHDAAQQSASEVLVGFVQPGLLPRATGIAWTGQKRVILLELGDASVSVFAHEIGHYYGLGQPHCPAKDKKPRCPTPQIQGFRVSPSGGFGYNKHKGEGNQQAGNWRSLNPLMAWAIPHQDLVFIKKADYRKLFDTIADASPQSQAWTSQPPEPELQTSLLAALLRPRAAFAQSSGAGSAVLQVSGIVTNGEIRLDRVRETIDGRTAKQPEAGPLSLELIDSDGGVLQTIPFAAIPQDPWHGDPDGPSHFQLEVPSAAGLHAVRVRGPEGSTDDRERSSSPPVVEAKATTQADDSRLLRWSTRDADGDAVRADVFLRADDGGPWHGAAIGLPQTELILEAWELPAGERVTARIVVSDGFNTAATEVDLGPGAPLGVLTVTPVDGATGVARTLDITAWVSNPMIEADALVVPLPKGSFRLTDPEGEEVFADIGYQPGTNVVTLTPVETLRPGTRYTATLEDLEDLWGNRLAVPVVWSFVTEQHDQDASDDDPDQDDSPE